MELEGHRRVKGRIIEVEELVATLFSIMGTLTGRDHREIRGGSGQEMKRISYPSLER